MKPKIYYRNQRKVYYKYKKKQVVTMPSAKNEVNENVKQLEIDLFKELPTIKDKKDRSRSNLLPA